MRERLIFSFHRNMCAIGERKKRSNGCVKCDLIFLCEFIDTICFEHILSGNFTQNRWRTYASKTVL